MFSKSKKNITLKKVLREKRLKQNQLAFMIGIAQSKMSDIINGYVKPTDEEAYNIALVLDKSMNVLFPDGWKEY